MSVNLPPDWEHRFVINGQPIVQKNSKTVRVMPARGKPGSHRCPHCSGGIHAVMTLSKAARKWRGSAVQQLAAQWPYRQSLPPNVLLNAQIVSYMKTRRTPDASNLYQGPEDAMQEEAAGVLVDDSCIASHDGCRRDYDPKKPRVEIVLTPYAALARRHCSGCRCFA